MRAARAGAAAFVGAAGIAGGMAMAQAASLAPGAIPPIAPDVALEAMTSPELRARIDAGTTTVLVPVGGTEQNGAHIALGKHNARAALLASRIAQTLGDAVVAPVMAYVPEGRVDPPQAHMRWAGTISVPEPAFVALVSGAADSLCHHGFRWVLLLGDHGSTQAALQRAAAAVRRPGCTVAALPEYYRAAQDDFARRLEAQGHAKAEIGQHAGLADTALTLALAPGLVRPQMQAAGPSAGTDGDPRRATAELGAAGVDRIVERSVEAIRALRSPRPARPSRP